MKTRLRDLGLARWALVVGICWSSGGALGNTPRAYERVVDLVDRLYLHPETVTAAGLLRASAQRAARVLPWLMVESEGDAVYLVHGDGEAVGSVSVASMETLPAALEALENLLADSGHPLGDVDLRLELLEGLTSGLDRYSRVLAGDRLARFESRLKGASTDVGLTVLRMADGLVVAAVQAGGPAARSGIVEGDRLLAIDSVPTESLSTREVRRRLRGAPGSEVRLLVEQGKGTRVLPLRRERALVPNVETHELPDGVGYVKVQHFSQRTVESLAPRLERLLRAGGLRNGLVLDLRGNTGGSMPEAARAADLFVDQGLILRTVGPDGRRVENLKARIDAVERPGEPSVPSSVPVVVLVDEWTASGSEIVAGSLVELGRAAVVGAETFGKGTVQKIYPLDEGMRLKLTVARYVLENERIIEHDGLAPDVRVEEITLTEPAVRVRSPDPESPVPLLRVVREDRSWRGEEREPGDAVLELARRAVLGAEDSSREAVVESLVRGAAIQERLEEERFHEALSERGFDWSEGHQTHRPANVDVNLQLVSDPARPRQLELLAEVENLGEHVLSRTAVELTCPTFDLLSGLVVPIGSVAPGQRAVGSAKLVLPPGTEPRVDLVRAYLRTAGRGVKGLGERALPMRSHVPVRLSFRVSHQPDGLLLVVENESAAALDGLELIVTQGAKRHAHWFDTLERSGSFALPAFDDADALEITVESDRLGRLGRYAFASPSTGGVVRASPPRLHAGRPQLRAAVGSLALPVVVSDDRRVDYVVVMANGEKVAWIQGTGRSLRRTVPVPVRLGVNQVVLRAVDDQGLSTRLTLGVLGESSTADAADED